MYNPWTCTKEQGNAGGRDSTGWRRRRKGRKKWNNCNSIINKIHLKIMKQNLQRKINIKVKYKVRKKSIFMI